MLEQSIRPLYQRMFVNVPAKWVGGFASANTITVLSGLFAVFILPLLLLGWKAAAIFFLLLSGYCDTLDGTVARLRKNSSEWGSVLDICTDRVVEFIVIFSLWAEDPPGRSLWVILMLGSVLFCITSFLVVGIFSENRTNKSFYYSPGLMERAEAFIFFIAMMVWPRAFCPLAIAFCLLVLWTGAVRLREFYCAREASNIQRDFS